MCLQMHKIADMGLRVVQSLEKELEAQPRRLPVKPETRRAAAFVEAGK